MASSILCSSYLSQHTSRACKAGYFPWFFSYFGLQLQQKIATWLEKLLTLPLRSVPPPHPQTFGIGKPRSMIYHATPSIIRVWNYLCSSRELQFKYCKSRVKFGNFQCSSIIGGCVGVVFRSLDCIRWVSSLVVVVFRVISEFRHASGAKCGNIIENSNLCMILHDLAFYGILPQYVRSNGSAPRKSYPCITNNRDISTKPTLLCNVHCFLRHQMNHVSVLWHHFYPS